MDLARFCCSGVDVWLTTRPSVLSKHPERSGMKAALNGVPSLSILDGWWIEGHVEAVTGWVIGCHGGGAVDPVAEDDSLYDKLEHAILPLYYGKPEA